MKAFSLFTSVARFYHIQMAKSSEMLVKAFSVVDNGFENVSVFIK